MVSYILRVIIISYIYYYILSSLNKHFSPAAFFNNQTLYLYIHSIKKNWGLIRNTKQPKLWKVVNNKGKCDEDADEYKKTRVIPIYT